MSKIEEMEHPKARLARQQAMTKLMQEQADYEYERETTSRFKLRYVHIPCEGITIAYQLHTKQNGRYGTLAKVSVAHTHPNDCFNRARGRFVAANNFNKGNWILVKRSVWEIVSWAEQLRCMFN